MSEDWRETTSFSSIPPPGGASVSSGPSVSYVSSGPSIAPTGAASVPSVTKERLYYPAPPIIQTYHQYQDVNNDKNLQNMETLFFLKRTIECINYNKSWKGLKKFKKHLNSPNGYEIIHKLLKLFVRRGNTNWYDLKVQKDLVLDYIKHKLSKL
jgi:hypothetical protein